MIFENYSMAYRNVVSKYYNFHPDQLDHAINSFVQLLVENDYHPTGNIFYSMIIELAEDGLMTAEIFIPIEESNFTNNTGEQLFFRSYFLIESMIMTRILNDFEQKASEKFVELHHYIKNNGLQKRTPIFVEYKTSIRNELYAEMSVGV